MLLLFPLDSQPSTNAIVSNPGLQLLEIASVALDQVRAAFSIIKVIYKNQCAKQFLPPAVRSLNDVYRTSTCQLRPDGVRIWVVSPSRAPTNIPNVGLQ